MDWGELAIVGGAFAAIGLVAVAVWRIRPMGGRPRRNHWIGGLKGGGHFEPNPPGYDDINFDAPLKRSWRRRR